MYYKHYHKNLSFDNVTTFMQLISKLFTTKLDPLDDIVLVQNWLLAFENEFMLK